MDSLVHSAVLLLLALSLYLLIRVELLARKLGARGGSGVIERGGTGYPVWRPGMGYQPRRGQQMGKPPTGGSAVSRPPLPDPSISRNEREGVIFAPIGPDKPKSFMFVMRPEDRLFISGNMVIGNEDGR